MKEKDKKVTLIEKNGKIIVKVKIGKGKYKYLRYKNNIPLDAYIKYTQNPQIKLTEYKKEYRKKWADKYATKIITNIKEKKQKGIGRIKRTRKPLEQTIEKGIGITIIKNIQTAGNTELKKAYKELLKNLVLDKELLNMIAIDDTMSKLRYRIEQKAIFNGEAELERGKYENIETKLGIATTIGQKTPRETIQDIKTMMTDNTLLYISGKGGSSLIQKLNNAGYTYKHQQDGKAGRVDLMLIFRKG